MKRIDLVDSVFRNNDDIRALSNYGLKWDSMRELQLMKEQLVGEWLAYGKVVSKQR